MAMADGASSLVMMRILPTMIIESVQYRSAKVTRGYTFICVKGGRRKGNYSPTGIEKACERHALQGIAGVANFLYPQDLPPKPLTFVNIEVAASFLTSGNQFAVNVFVNKTRHR